MIQGWGRGREGDRNVQGLLVHSKICIRPTFLFGVIFCNVLRMDTSVGTKNFLCRVLKEPPLLDRRPTDPPPVSRRPALTDLEWTTSSSRPNVETWNRSSNRRYLLCVVRLIKAVVVYYSMFACFPLLSSCVCVNTMNKGSKNILVNKRVIVANGSERMERRSATTTTAAAEPVG